MVGTRVKRFGFAITAVLMVVGTAAAQNSRLDQNLMVEVRNGRVERVAALLEQGADVNTRQRDTSALATAADRRHPAVVELLLAHGAEVCEHALHRTAVRGDADLVRLVLSHTPNAAQIGEPALLHAAFLGRTESVALLLDRGVPVDAVHRTNGRTAIMQAVEQGRIATVELLIARGADLNARDPDGRSLLSLAGASEELNSEQRETLIGLLRNAGARD